MSRPAAFRGLLFWLKLPHAFLADSKLIHSQKGSPSGSGIVLSESSCVNTDWYCLFKMSAQSFEALNKCPLSFKGAIPVESLRNYFM